MSKPGHRRVVAVMITASSFFVLVAAPWAGPDTRMDEVLDSERLTALSPDPSSIAAT